MSWVSVRSIGQITVVAIAAMCCHPAFGQDVRDPDRLLQDADKLAWIKAWTRAAPLYGEAERLFTARGRSSERAVRRHQSPPRRPSSPGCSGRLAAPCGISRRPDRPERRRASSPVSRHQGRDGRRPRPLSRRAIVARSAGDRRTTRRRGMGESRARGTRTGRLLARRHQHERVQAGSSGDRRAVERRYASRSSVGSRSSDTAMSSWAERSSRWITTTRRSRPRPPSRASSSQ